MYHGLKEKSAAVSAQELQRLIGSYKMLSILLKVSATKAEAVTETTIFNQ
jgi:hypothetical protein